jgi:hypothetical protein
MIYDGKVSTAADAFKEYKDIYPSDQDFQGQFRVKQERSNPKAQYLLRYLEGEERRLANPGRAEEEEIGAITVEHILPKNPGTAWEPVTRADESIVDDCVYRLGNLCLLTKINKDLGSAVFASKKPVYAKSTIILTRKVADQDQWNRQTIDHRQAHMAKLAVAIWRF